MIKLLFLPGYLQSGSLFAEKSSGLRKILTKKFNYTLDYVDPPVVIPTKESLPFDLGDDASEKWKSIEERNLNRCWWMFEDDCYIGMDRSLKFLLEHIRENGPYDGIVGFSQGASMAAIMANLIESLVPEHGSFRIAMFFSGFAFTQPLDPSASMSGINSDITDIVEYKSLVKITEEYEHFFNTKLHSSSTTFISIFGTEDGVVPPVRSEYLNSLYLNIKVFQHDGGHLMPNKKVLLSPLTEFIRDVLELKPVL